MKKCLTDKIRFLGERTSFHFKNSCSKHPSSPMWCFWDALLCLHPKHFGSVAAFLVGGATAPSQIGESGGDSAGERFLFAGKSMVVGNHHLSIEK